jgi:hypothetical protein
MVARSVDSADRRVRRAHELARPPISHSLRPRLAAFAPSMVEVVRSAGGWLFDRVMAGWDVTVITPDHSDSRPLQILGVRVRDLETTLAMPILGPCLSAIAVRSDLYDRDARVRRMVLTASDEGLAEIRFWGDLRPEDLDGTADPVWHRMSVAARAFKAQALAAAAAAPADPNEYIEMFRRGEVGQPSPVPARQGPSSQVWAMRQVPRPHLRPRHGRAGMAFVCTSRNGRRKSSVFSRGIPSTRSLMMLRAISVLPPPRQGPCRPR